MAFSKYSAPKDDRVMNNVDLDQLKSLITEQTGLRIVDGNTESFSHLVQDRMKAFRLTLPADYHRLLLSFGKLEWAEEHAYFSRGLTTGETYFFRDQGQMNVLSRYILPELIARNQAQRRLRLWSAGCSSGEEAYSLAVLLDELAVDLSDWQIFILGTDINPEALAKAQLGAYSEWSFRQVSPERRERYFRLCRGQWLLDPRIRQQVHFRRLNLVTTAFPEDGSGLQPMDLILCRNVFIYLEPDTVSRIADKITASLAEGGYLMTGHSELYAHPLGELRTRIFPDSIVYQKSRTQTLKAPQAPMIAPPKPVIEKKAIPLISAPIANEFAAGQPATGPVLQADAPATMQDAWNHANRGQQAKARACCEKLIAQNPLDHHPYYLSALLAQEQEKTEEAKMLLKKVVYLAPEYVSAYLELGEIYLKENNRALAQKMWLLAQRLLQPLPQDKPIEMFGDSTAGDILQFVENRLAALAQPAKSNFRSD
jgi:chemotaxis protein methyltransferase CheR